MTKMIGLNFSCTLFLLFYSLHSTLAFETITCNERCGHKLCESLKLVKCPYDPYCVKDIKEACKFCPHGARPEDDCKLISYESNTS